MLFDLVYKLPRSMFFVSDFLNFVIKENMFRGLDCALEQFSIIQTSCCSIVVQSMIAFFIPPTFGMFCNMDSFSI